jgi:4-amino-4-deoxy-L-arabinose transferase-like glycosyltransferase
MIGMWLPIWTLLAGPPIHPRSEARYAFVSRDMAQRDSWLVPYNGDQPHLTKPPLTYWLEAASITVLGPTELAVRLPSAVAGSLVVVLLVGLGTKLYGRRFGLIAGAILAVMPLHIVVSRLTLTDGPLALWWFATLAFGYLSVRESHRLRWPVLLWSAVALGWLTKGPLILLPLAALLVWLIAGSRWRDIAKLRPLVGLPLSMLPILAWAVTVAITHEQALDVWRTEVLGRASGGGAHAAPLWFFLPVLLVGMFPATAMMNLPGLNHPAGRTWRLIRIGRERALWLWAVVLPLIVFSIPAGKLATYILPVAPPLALLVAPVIDGWLTRRADGRKGWPDVRITLFVVAVVVTVGGFIAVYRILGSALLWIAVPAVPILIAAGYAMFIWNARPQRRRSALIALWATVIVAWMCGHLASTIILNRFATPVLLSRIEAETALTVPFIATFDHEDEALAFYTGRFVPRIDGADQVAALADQYGRNLVIVAEPPDWAAMAEANPDVAGRFDHLFNWPSWPGDESRDVYRPR